MESTPCVPEARIPRWLRLDNTAKIWPALLSRRYTTLFRLSAVFKERIRVEAAQAALEDCMRRFPYFAVEIRRGLFWYSLKHRADLPRLEADSRNPCMKARLLGKSRWPFRVRAFNCRLSVEFSHMITDGTGALEFLRYLVARYCVRRGLVPEASLPLPAGDSPEPDPEEWKDAYQDLLIKHPGALPKLRDEEAAYHPAARLLPPGNYTVISGFLPLAPVVGLAKGWGVTLTEYLAAALLLCLQELQAEELAESRRPWKTRPLRLNVPVNLRKLFPSRTLRNFFSYTDPGIDPRLGDYSFEEILDQVRNHMKFQIKEKRMRLIVTRNLKGEKSLFNRLVPLFLKNLVLSQVYRLKGDKRFSASFSNLGKVELPEDIGLHLDRFVFLPPPSPVCTTNVAALSFGEHLCLSFGSLGDNRSLARAFFRFFTKAGLPVFIESNQTDESEEFS